MVKLSLLTAVAFTFLAGGVAIAKEKAKVEPREKKICLVTKKTSSRIPAKKDCRTQAEWDAVGGQESLDDAEGRLRGMSRGN
ncbi:MAG: hypothetical protein WBR13_12220 [Allosphingosinicella sp.]